MNKIKLNLTFTFLILLFAVNCFAQNQQNTDDLEFTVDVNSPTSPLPKIFKPNLDLSGRGFNNDKFWPQGLASKGALEAWQKDIGFTGFYRLQYNLWDLTQLNTDQEAHAKMLANYEAVIKNISDSGGVVILDIFGTPAGLGKILDKKSAPINISAYKELIKDVMRDLSCEKKYNIWYEVWNAPDLEGFFLGREQDYFNLYRAVSEGARDLESQYKVHIPVGAPAVSWWFHNIEGNTIRTPEKSLIYALIKFCYDKHLGLDFITWHAFSTDPKAEKENTIYDKKAVGLMRDWLSYFNFDKNTPLIIDEWNYDRDANLLPERKEKSYIAASYIPARIKNMYEAGIDNQIYFCLEDFQNNKEGVTRNVGVFYYLPGHSQYIGGKKSTYNIFKMFKMLGDDMFSLKLNDEFVGAIATKSEDKITILIYNYIDPEITKDSLSENIAELNPAENKFLLGLIRSDQLLKIMSGETKIDALSTSAKVKSFLKNTQKLNELAERFQVSKRNLKIVLKNLKGDYLYSIYTTDSSCNLDCEFKPSSEKEISAADSYTEDLSLNPYSVSLIVLNKKPEPVAPEALQPEVVPSVTTPSEPAMTEVPKTEAPKAEEPKEEAPKNTNAAGK